MNRLPRALSVVALGGPMVFAQLGAAPASRNAPPPAAADAPASNAAAPAPADGAATAPPPAAAGGQAKMSVADQVENFWHYTRIARYDLAKNAAQALLSSGATPREITENFERVTARGNVTVDEWLARVQQIDAMRDTAAKLVDVINKGLGQRNQDVAFIKANIERLSGTPRGAELARQLLRNSGELAAALMVQYLQDPRQEALHFPIRQALTSMGKVALGPLVEATQTRNETTLITVVTVLGNLGYKDAGPYIARVLTRPDVGNGAKVAASRALSDLGINAQQTSLAQLFYDQSERFYYEQANITPDRTQPTADLWAWEGNTLGRTQVPTPIYNEMMAMRSAENAMRTGDVGSAPLSLWLAANYKREIETPAGMAMTNLPDAHYYGVSAGARYLNEVVARSLRDGNSVVALHAIRSLQEIVGRSNLFSGGSGQPLTAALQSTSRPVRLAAAFAIASTLPNQQFANQDRVVPLLAEALGQSEKAAVLIAAGSEAERTRLANALGGQYRIAGGIGVQSALAQAETLPTVDVILLARDLRQSDVDQLLSIAGQNVRLQGAAKIILRANEGGPYAAMAATDPSHTISVSTAADGQILTRAINDARSKAGLSMDQAEADQMAIRAAHLLRDLAINGNTVLDASGAEPALVASISDARHDVAMAGGEVLALVNSNRAQPSLAAVALDAKTPEPLAVSLLNSLANSAKFWGNRLQGGSITPLQQAAAGNQSLAIRSAAAEALGALNLPNEQAQQLILQRPMTSTAPARPMQNGAMPGQPATGPASEQPPAATEPPPAGAAEPADAGAAPAQPADAGAAQPEPAAPSQPQ